MPANNNVQIKINVNDKQLQKLDTTFQQTTTSAEGLATASKTVGQTIGGKGKNALPKSLGQSRMAMTNLNFTLRDAPFLFKNFNMGVMAISNNLPMLVDNIAAVRKESTGWKQTFKTLKTTMMGPAGLSVAISAITFVLTSMAFIFAKTGKEAVKSASSMDDFAEAIIKARDALDEGPGFDGLLRAAWGAIKNFNLSTAGILQAVGENAVEAADGIKELKKASVEFYLLRGLKQSKDIGLIEDVLAGKHGVFSQEFMTGLKVVHETLTLTEKAAFRLDKMMGKFDVSLLDRPGLMLPIQERQPFMPVENIPEVNLDQIPESWLVDPVQGMNDMAIAAASMGSVIQSTIVASLSNGVDAAKAFENAFKAMILNMVAQFAANAAMFFLLNAMFGGAGIGTALFGKSFGAALFNPSSSVDATGDGKININMPSVVTMDDALVQAYPTYERGQTYARRG